MQTRPHTMFLLSFSWKLPFLLFCCCWFLTPVKPSNGHKARMLHSAGTALGAVVSSYVPGYATLRKWQCATSFSAYAFLSPSSLAQKSVALPTAGGRQPAFIGYPVQHFGKGKLYGLKVFHRVGRALVFHSYAREDIFGRPTSECFLYRVLQGRFVVLRIDLHVQPVFFFFESGWPQSDEPQDVFDACHKRFPFY